MKGDKQANRQPQHLAVGAKLFQSKGCRVSRPWVPCAGMVDPGSYARGESQAQLLVTKDMAETVLAH